MELEGLAALSGVRPCVYRAAVKLRTLQRQCRMDLVFVRHIPAALPARGRTERQREVTLDKEEVTQSLITMFSNVSQEMAGEEASHEACMLLFRIFDRSRSGQVSAASFQTALICLSAETPPLKYRALVCVAERGSGSISRAALRSVLQDIRLVLLAIQEEEGVFGSVEEAVKSCFKGALTSQVARDHVLSWLQSEPQLLLWLPILHRLSVSESVSHAVRCHICKSFPINGLRYRCRTCINVQVCQSCFLADRRTRRHKSHHEMIEFCKQPTVRESLSSFVATASHILLPRRSTRRQADRRDLKGEEPPDSQNSGSSSAGPVSREASPHGAQCLSKALQTDSTEQLQASALQTDVKNLQRDKWIQEQQLQAWRLTVQSEQSMLENRCCEMEVTLQTLKEQNLYLQGKLAQTLSSAGLRDHSGKSFRDTNKTQDETTAEKVKRNVQQFEQVKTPTEVHVSEEHSEAETSEEESEDEDRPKTEDERSEKEAHTPPPAGSWDSAQPQDLHGGEDTTAASHRTEQKPPITEAQPGKEDGRRCEASGGMGSPEELLQDVVDGLKTAMETEWEPHQQSRTGDPAEADLLEGLRLLEESFHHLVDAVTSHTDTEQSIKTLYLPQ